MTDTDTIFKILGNLDSSGYKPYKLYKKLKKEDFSTEIGERAKDAYENYVETKENRVIDLVNINLNDKKLLLNRIAENDTLLLNEILLNHKGYNVLDFWATWCAPCRSFNKSFKEQYLFYKKKGIEFYGIGIRIDNKNERDKFLTAIKNDNTPWQQFIDFNNETYGLFETNAVPFQVLLGKNNEIMKIFSHDVSKELDELLNAKQN